MSTVQPNIRSDPARPYKMNEPAPFDIEANIVHPEQPTSTTQNPSASGSGNSSSNLPSLQKAQPAATTKPAKAPRKKFDCWGCWTDWKLLPGGLKASIIICGIICFGFLSGFWVGIWKSGTARIKKEEQRQREIERLDVENAITQQVSVMALAGRSSDISLPPAMAFPIVISPTPFTRAPARSTFLTHVRVTMSTNSINSPTPSAGMATSPGETWPTTLSNSTGDRLPPTPKLGLGARFRVESDQ